MSHGRQMGFLWGAQVGAGIAAACAGHPAFLLLIASGLLGVWAFREND